ETIRRIFARLVTTGDYVPCRRPDLAQSKPTPPARIVSSRTYSPIVRSPAETADRTASAGSTTGASTASALDVAVGAVRRDQDRYRGRCPLPRPDLAARRRQARGRQPEPV